MRSIAFAAVAAALLASPANARCFDVVSRVLVERTVPDAKGHQRTSFQQTNMATPGDKLVFQFDYRNAQQHVANVFVITNPIPAQLVYAGAESPGEQVSVDGGQTFGSISDLKVVEADGIERIAEPQDVTHVRWVVRREMPTGSGGQLSFRAVMRDVNVLPSREVQMAMR